MGLAKKPLFITSVGWLFCLILCPKAQKNYANSLCGKDLQKQNRNRTVTVRRPVRAARLRKTPVGLAPFVAFCSATVWAGVVAAQRPITCPNRQLQLER
jgi:hypothetical protein